jgi:hypothetical protein
MNLINQLDFPQIPEELLLSKQEVEEALTPVTLYHRDGTVYSAPWYHVYTCNDTLSAWIKNLLPFEVQYVEYIISDQAITLHKDIGRTRALNYILDTGGEQVTTEFFDDDENLLLQKVCEPHTWYDLNVGMYHRVAEPQDHARFLISVTPKDGVTYLLEDCAPLVPPV